MGIENNIFAFKKATRYSLPFVQRETRSNDFLVFSKMADPSLIPRSSPLFKMAVKSNSPPWRPLWMSNQKPERRRPFGTGLVRHCPQGLFSPFFTFLRATFFRPFRLSLVPTICPWVSEDANTLKMEHWWRGRGEGLSRVVDVKYGYFAPFLAIIKRALERLCACQTERTCQGQTRG